MDYNNPKFINFLDEVSTVIRKDVPIKNYFFLKKEKKIVTQYTILQITVKTIKNIITYNNIQLYAFIHFLEQRNAETEHYELSGVMRDIRENFDELVNMKKIDDNSKLINKV